MADLVTKVGFQPHPATKNAIKAIDQTSVALRGVAKADFEVAKSATVASQAVAGIGKAVPTAINKSTSAIQGMNQELGKTKKALTDVGDQALLSKKNVEGLREFRQAGRLQSFGIQNLGALGAGGGAAGGAFGAATTAFNVLDTIPKLGLTLDVLKQSVVENVAEVGKMGKGIITATGAAGNSAPIIGSVATGLTAMFPGLTGTAAGIGAIAIVAAPFIAIAAAGAIALKGLSDEIGRNEEAAEAAAKASRDLAAQELENLELVKTRTAEANRQEFELLQEQFALKQSQLERELVLIAELDAQFEALGASFSPGERNRLASAANKRKGNVDAFTTELIKMGDSIENNFKVLQPAIDAREKEETAIRSQLDALRETAAGQSNVNALAKQGSQALQERQAALKQEIEGIQKIAPELAALAKTSDEAQAAFEEYGERLKELESEQEAVADALPIAETNEAAAALKAFNAEVGRTALGIAKATLATKNQQEDALAATEKRAESHAGKLAKIETDGQKKVEDLRAKLSGLGGGEQSALGDIETKRVETLADIDNTFFDESRDSLEAFRKSELRLEEDANRKRIRLIEDREDALDDAQRSGSAIDFLKTQRDFQKKLKRSAEDEGTAEQRRIEDFAAQQQQIAATRRQDIAATLAGIAEERAATVAGFAERKLELAAQIDAEKASIQEKLNAEIDANKKAEAAIIAKLDKEALRRQQLADLEARFTNDTMQAIQIKAAAEIRAANAVAAILGASPKAAAPVASSKSSGGKSIGFGAFAKGGIITKPTLALLGDGQGPEAVIPLNKGGSTAKGAGLFNPTINISATIGDIASKGDVIAGMNEVVDEMMDGLRGYQSGNLAGNRR